MQAADTIMCPKCRALYGSGATYCPRCGADLVKRRGRRSFGTIAVAVVGVIAMLAPFSSIVRLQGMRPASEVPPAPVSSWVRAHQHGGYALGQYADLGKWGIALTAFRTVQGSTIDRPANGRVWLVTSWKLLNPTLQRLQVHERDWKATSLGVPIPAETGTGAVYGRSVEVAAFPNLQFVTPGHAVAGTLAFQIFGGDRNPAITVSGVAQNHTRVFVTWRIDLGAADRNTSA